MNDERSAQMKESHQTESEMVWRDLKSDPPTGDEYAVLLFPCKSDCGVLYSVSNPHYARGRYALDAGYTHWAEFTLAPDHDHWVDWQNELNYHDIEHSKKG